ncbi:MAG: DNA polymerase III subunit delta [Alphaproteobacteria bacterium]|nr:DNA polymerase III subunit delta [Alphaproteobacteria bacterium]
MKISASKAESFIRSPGRDTRAVLIYGPDSGLVRERINSLSDVVTDGSKDPFSFAEFSSALLAKDPVRLVDEVLAVSFGGGRRVIIVRDGGDELSAPVSAVLDNEAANHPMAALIVIGAGNLTPRSSLRRLFEGNDACAALPCYPDDGAGLAQLIRGSLAAEDIGIDPAALHVAAALLGADRQANRREIEKLILFAGPGGNLTEESVLACLGDSAEASTDEAVLSAADGNYDGLVEHLTRVWADGIEPVAVIRNAQRHFQRLHYVLSQTQDGVALDAALKQLRPPLFWRVAGRFRTQLNSWSLAAVEASLLRLTDAELSAKTTGAPAALVCDRALMAITQLARSGRRTTH